MRYTVKARYGNQELDVREFVLPKGAMVADVLEEVRAGANGLEDLVWRCWDWVCQNIQYPPLPLATADYHREEAFLRGSSAPGAGFMPIKRSIRYEFFQFPFETLDAPCFGDCDDTAILLCSLLRAIPLFPDEVYVAMGKVAPYYHAWVRLSRGSERFVLETTLNEAFPGGPYQIYEVEPYEPLLYFNDQQAFEVNGGLEEIRSAVRDEAVKVSLIRGIYQQAIDNKKISAKIEIRGRRQPG